MQGVSWSDRLLTLSNDERRSDHHSRRSGEPHQGKLRDIELLVGIPHVPIASDHLVVKNSHESLDSKDVVSENESLDHVHLGTTNLVITVLFVPHSVFIEPVVSLGLGVKRVAKVGWTRARHPVQWTVVELEVVDQLLVSPLVVLLHDSEVTYWGL